MEQATEVIINTILVSCGSALFALICFLIKKVYSQIQTYDKVLKGLSHDAFFRCCRELDPKIDLSEEEVENLNLLYEGYNSLGLNGTGEKLYKQIIAKSVRVSV